MEFEQGTQTLILRAMNKARHTIIIKSVNDIQVVDYDDVARPDGRHTANGNKAQNP